MFDISSLFYKRFCNDRFIDEISILPAQDEMLRAARKLVRQSIRSAFNDARTYLKNSGEIQDTDIELVSKIKPKFMTQGSFAYKTLNAPCYLSQEIDLDDGVYLPMSIIESKPQANKDWFFAIVDGALEKLANSNNGWKVTKKKDTCARLILPNQAHIDVPLYAIPDERHAHMTEAMAILKAEGRQLSDAIYGEDLVAAKRYWLDQNEVFLATRNNGWKKSDPLLIANWFRQEAAIKKRLRRICRFLKAWRDYTWESGGPSSLTLMVCAAEAYPDDDLGREDHVLLTIAKALVQRLGGEVCNPAVKDREVLYPRDNINTAEVVMAAQALADTIGTSISGANSKGQVIQKLTGRFGNRMPCNAEWIEVITGPGLVRATPAVAIKPEPIPNARSG
jgi:hypothetical protein